MNKEEILKTLMLLSALESWSFSSKTPLPDYLRDDLEDVIFFLRKELLK